MILCVTTVKRGAMPQFTIQLAESLIHNGQDAKLCAPISDDITVPFENKNVHDILDQYEIPFIIENDVNLAVVGYHTVEESVVFLYQPGSMYSGCGIMLDGQLYRGSTLFAGEVGYLNGCAFVEPEDFDAAQMTIKRSNGSSSGS